MQAWKTIEIKKTNDEPKEIYTNRWQAAFIGRFGCVNRLPGGKPKGDCRLFGFADLSKLWKI
jgi:hypothetical protein